MLTDWLIYLDLLEENNCNTSFLRLITPIIFGIIECNNYNSTCGYGIGYGYSNSISPFFNFGDGDGYGNGDGNGNGILNNDYYQSYTIIIYKSFYNEEH